MSSGWPAAAPGNGAVFKGGKPGTCKVYIDDLRIRHADGKTTTLWPGRNDTKTAKVAETSLFNGARVRTIDMEDVAK